jgi:hypothetical protein
VPRKTKTKKWNRCPEWAKTIAGFDRLIAQISTKLAPDADLAEDAKQEALIALYQTFPEQIAAHADYVAGRITERAWRGHLKRYLGNVIRNSMLSYLTRHKTGSWQIGRKGKAPRYSSYEAMEQAGWQIDEKGSLWKPKGETDAMEDGRYDEHDEKLDDVKVETPDAE